jgi:hypothetical protein
MINVAAYIRELLCSHDCVVLPTLGGFIGNYTPARIDSATNTFSPPVKAISFNRNLHNNDGLLISRISVDRGMGYADSRRVVEEYIEDIKTRLNRGERVEIDMIGHFQNNSEGNVLFEPARDTNFLLDSYGLPSFIREPVNSYDVNSRVINRRNLDSKPQISRKMWIRAAVAVPILAVLIFVPLKTDLLKSSASLNPMARVELEDTKTPVSEVVVEDSQSATEEVNAIVKEPIENSVESPALQKEPEASFKLITGSFKARENALRQIDDLRVKGYKAEISSASNGYFRVVASSFASIENANIERASIEKDYPGTWILKD